MNSELILGISAFYHDSAACIVRGGEIIAAAQEERFSRKKHDHSFPSSAVSYCLQEASARPEDLAYVAFYDKPWLKFERLLETYLSFAPRGLASFLKALPLWLKEKLWMEDLIRKELGYEKEIIYPEHHQSHAASAFYPSPFESAAVLTLDGVGEWACASLGVGKGNKLTLSHELRFPHSLGLLYSAFTYFCGFKVNSGEYKLMGLAPYGEPKYVDVILDELLDLKPDGSFRLNLKYFEYCYGLKMTSSALDGLFGGPPRRPESTITQREMDLARSIQEVTEEVMLRMARHARERTGQKNLVLAGGVALNCVGNGKILRENIFDNIWIQPASGDAGGALGAALFTAHHYLGLERRVEQGTDSQKGSYLGPAFSTDAIEGWLRTESITHQRLDFEDLASRVASYLQEGKVVGWFRGRMEFGPRALGARSILGDARNSEMQRTLNLKIKYRESFRPFAPVCLEEDVSDFFELGEKSPYMLLVAPVVEARRQEVDPSLSGLDRLKAERSSIPAVTHVDYSARVQTVDKHSNPDLYTLLTRFKENTSEGILINTSFNVRGEPLVCTPEDAYECFMRTEMDVLVLEDCLLLKAEQPQRLQDESWKEEFPLD